MEGWRVVGVWLRIRVYLLVAFQFWATNDVRSRLGGPDRGGLELLCGTRGSASPPAPWPRMRLGPWPASSAAPGRSSVQRENLHVVPELWRPKSLEFSDLLSYYLINK